MSATVDQKTTRYGSNITPPVNLGIAAAVTVYRGTIALTAGTGGNAGYLKNASSPLSTDICWGIIQKVGPGSDLIDSGPGITGGATNGAVTAEVETGAFFLGSSTGSDQLSAATLGQVVYVYNETTVAATSGSGTRPPAGVHVASDTTGRYPGGYAIRMGSTQSTGA